MNKWTPQRKHLRDTLKGVMRKKLWTQAQLAAAMGIGEDVLSTWITGRSMASYKKLKSAAESINMTIDEFLLPGGEAECIIDPEPPKVSIILDVEMRRLPFLLSELHTAGMTFKAYPSAANGFYHVEVL